MCLVSIADFVVAMGGFRVPAEPLQHRCPRSNALRAIPMGNQLLCQTGSLGDRGRSWRPFAYFTILIAVALRFLFLAPGSPVLYSILISREAS